MIARAKGPFRERGEALVLCMAMSTILFALLVIGVDLPYALMKKTEQESALNLARDAEIAPAVGIVAKNSDDPGLVVAKALADTLREGGYEGAVEVWFYEVPASQLPPNKRVYGYEVVLRADYEPFFARTLGETGMHVESSLVALSMPYAETAVWRPASARCGVYAAGEGEGASAMSFATKSFGELPRGLREQIDGGVEEANKQMEEH